MEQTQIKQLLIGAWSGFTLFAYGNMTPYDPTLVEL